MPAPESSDALDVFIVVVDRYLTDLKPLRQRRVNLALGQRNDIDRAEWRAQADLGVAAVMIPEQFGGLGLGVRAMGRIAELYGGHALGGVFLSTACLSLPILLASTGAMRDRVLTEAVSGAALIATALPTSAELNASDQRFHAERTRSGGWKVSGKSGPVIDADIADWLILPAASADGEVWFLVERAAITSIESGLIMDGGGAAVIGLNCTLASENELGTCEGSGSVIETVLTSGGVLLSSWLLGLAEEAFEQTLKHLRTRRQFGAPIGSFQALQHRMAVLYCDLAMARSVVEQALQEVDDGGPDAALLASAAKARMGMLAYRVSNEAVQLHGAIGLTEEADISFFLKGARLADVIGGHSYFHRTRAGKLLMSPTGAHREP
jgi:alkylation response protein AidB-like acyl-CoA dehydrogenase